MTNEPQRTSAGSLGENTKLPSTMGFLVPPVSWFHRFRCFKGFVVSWYGLLGLLVSWII